MKSVKKLLGRGLLAGLLALAFVSCGNSDQKENQSNNSVKKEKKKTVSSENLGKMELTISGDIEGKRTGTADFYYGSAGSIKSWDIGGHDSRTGQTFSLNLRIQSMNEEIPQPKPGTYKIGLAPNSTDIFNASFTDIIDRENHVQKQYGSRGDAGTLTIEVSNENRVKGHFEFTAHEADALGDASAQITVKGKFDAVNLMRDRKK